MDQAVCSQQNTHTRCQVWVTGRLKRPGLVTSGSSHQPPSLTRSVDGRICSEGERHTEREGVRDGESEMEREKRSNILKRRSEGPLERVHEKSFLPWKWTSHSLHSTTAQPTWTVHIRANEKGSFVYPKTHLELVMLQIKNKTLF